MCSWGEKTIISRLAPELIIFLLKNSTLFKGKFERTTFTVRESVFMSNKVLFPVITGLVVEHSDSTKVIISFKLSKWDKFGLGIFLLIILVLSLLLGFVSSDIFLTMTLLCFGVVVGVIFLMMYANNCRRAYKKLACLLDSITSN